MAALSPSACIAHWEFNTPLAVVFVLQAASLAKPKLALAALCNSTRALSTVATALLIAEAILTFIFRIGHLLDENSHCGSGLFDRLLNDIPHVVVCRLG